MQRTAQLLGLAILPALVASIVPAAPPGQLPAEQRPEALQQKIDRLIQQLGHEKYSLRERAQEELAELGFEAYDALAAAATHEDLEIATRARYLLRLIPAQWSIENEPPEVRRYLSYYESHSREIRMAMLKELADLPGGKGVAALCRLVRFEKSTEWSKHAAVVLMNREPVDQAGRTRWKKTVTEQLGRSSRPAAQWLRTYLELRDAPQAAVARWAKLAEAEQAVLQRSPDQSSPRIVSALWYYLAMAQAEQGDKETAEETAKKARQLSPTQTTTRLRARLDLAFALRRRGKLRWAEQEYRQVIEAGLTYPKVSAGITLSEMLHDQGDNLAAAKVLDDLLQVEQGELSRILNPVGRGVREVRARRSYFHASHWARQGDRVKQREFLDQAIKHDPAELDTLIARYQLPEAEPEYRQKTVQLIEKAAEALRQAVAESPDEATFYNQFAWLVGNTEGDLDRALAYAKKAVELEPETAAYLDTLAHVYFGRGDLENAVKYQTRAAELEPHSGLIAQKLELFRNALKEKQDQ